MNFTPDTKLRLLKDTVIVEVLPDRISAGGIFIPETSSGINLIRAEVLKKGSKFRFTKDVFLGDIVYVPEHFGTVLDLDSPDVKIYDGEDVYAIEDCIYDIEFGNQKAINIGPEPKAVIGNPSAKFKFTRE